MDYSFEALSFAILFFLETEVTIFGKEGDTEGGSGELAANASLFWLMKSRFKT